MFDSNSNTVFVILFSFVKVNHPFKLVGMHMTGKVAETEAGDIRVMVDYLSKWSEALALLSQTAANVSTCIVQFFYQFF